MQHRLSKKKKKGEGRGRRQTFAPLSLRYLRVGIAARIRVSSVIFRLSSSGTFKSARTKTTLPLSSSSPRSPTDFFAASTTKRALDALRDAIREKEAVCSFTHSCIHSSTHSGSLNVKGIYMTRALPQISHSPGKSISKRSSAWSHRSFRRSEGWLAAST